VNLGPNDLKQRFSADDGPVVWALFMALADPVAAEICAGAGFDLLVIDDEHGPNEPRTVLAQLQAVSAYPLEAAVRVVTSETAIIKRALDLGARTLVVPSIDTAEQAAAAVAATRYRAGTRGVASARAARWGRISEYHANADDDICVIVQLESATALENLEAICAVEGVDAAFVGPMDLATSLGHPGGGTLPEVVAIVEQAIARIAATGTTAGVMAMSAALIERYVAAGARLVATGVDTAILAAATTALRASLPDR
jgi:4-hydroxy-2-oxoheptanedioate aldolase